jgi:hypothetical protein
MLSLPGPYELEYQIVRARNRLDFKRRDKGDCAAAKIFVIGHPKTGTSSFHAMFTDMGLATQHSSGRWNVAEFDCFSDRGPYQPIDLLAKTYPNARFILNCRPLRGFLLSHAKHIARDGRAWRRMGISKAFFHNTLKRRNAYFSRAFKLLGGEGRLAVVNIAQPGAFQFAAGFLGFDRAQPDVHRHKTRSENLSWLEGKLDAFLESAKLTDQADEPFLLPTYTPDQIYADWQGFPDHLTNIRRI